VGERVQALEGDLLVAAVADPELLRLVVEPAQRVLDAVEVAALLAGEQERLLPLHGVGPLIGHVEGIAGQVRVRAVPGELGLFLEAPEGAKGTLPFAEEATLEVFDLSPVHRPLAPE